MNTINWELITQINEQDFSSENILKWFKKFYLNHHDSFVEFAISQLNNHCLHIYYKVYQEEKANVFFKDASPILRDWFEKVYLIGLYSKDTLTNYISKYQNMDIVDGLWIRLISSEYNQNLLQKHFPILYPMFNTVCRDKNKLQIASVVANVLSNKLDGWFEECFLFELSPAFRKNETRSEMLFFNNDELETYFTFICLNKGIVYGMLRFSKTQWLKILSDNELLGHFIHCWTKILPKLKPEKRGFYYCCHEISYFISQSIPVERHIELITPLIIKIQALKGDIYTKEIITSLQINTRVVTI